MLKRFWWCRLSGLILLATLAPSLSAQEISRPYRLRIVLDFARNRLLTDVFKIQVERELRDSLRAALGDLASVEVVHDHPRLQAVREQGLQRALDGWRQRSAYKTHFVMISYVRSAYEIRSRQHDGATGLVSPAVRVTHTHDRAFVARTTTLLVKQDFGWLGTVTEAPDADGLVKVKLRGGGRNTPLTRWVKKGDVFSLVHVVTKNEPGQQIPGSYLQVHQDPEPDGTCVCKLWNRYEIDKDKYAGLQCLQLGTVRAPLRLRLMLRQPDGSMAPLDSAVVQLQVRDGGFQGQSESLLSGQVDVAGYFDSTRQAPERTFGPLAFVTVNGPAIQKADVPIPVLDDRLVVVPVSRAEEGDILFSVSLQAFRRELIESLQVQDLFFTELRDLANRPGQRTAVLEQARTALSQSEMDHRKLQKEWNRLADQVRKSSDPAMQGISLAQEEKAIQRLKDGIRQLELFITNQEKIDREEKDPKRKQWLQMVDQAQLLEGRGDVEEALALYEKAQAGLKNPELAQRIDKLKKEWRLVNDEHARARRFIYKVWPDLDDEGVKRELPRALEYFAVLKQADINDYHSARKLLHATVAHATRMGKKLGELRPDINVDDVPVAERIREVAPKLRDLIEQVQAYLDRVGK
jgi:hypothetical protein